MTLPLFQGSALLLYLLAFAALYLRVQHIEGGNRQHLIKRLRYGSLAAALAAVALHGVSLYYQIHLVDPHGGATLLSLSLYAMLSLTAWTMNLIIITVALFKSIENLGLMSFPFAIMALLLSLFIAEGDKGVILAGRGLYFHILVSLFSYSLLGIAALQALLLALQDHHLRKRRLAGIIRLLPPLESMESLLFQLITIGYILLSVSLLTGATYLEDIFKQHLVHKTILSITAWVVFALLLWGRLQFGWRGRTAIRWTLVGFALLMVAYFGSKFVLEVVLA
ncbi:MAG: cytochrome c biogenesis protein CcsA [Gammaproteobacteria bacterium]|nr:cytochrome c biogenesis protein CcsA [Gammaproteobacteria bacterium]